MFEIGPTLRQARERQGRSVDDVAEATKIRASYLTALEEEQFDALPGPTYTRGFLRAYAQYLGLDPQPFVDEYAVRFAVPPWELEEDVIFPRRRSLRAGSRSRAETGIIVIALAAIVAIALLVIAASTYPVARSVPEPVVITATVTDAALDDLEPVNPIATAVTAAPREPTTPVKEPLPLTIQVREQTTLTVRVLGLDETVPPLFQREVDPAEDGSPTIVEIPLSPSGYLVRMDRPGTVVLDVDGRPVAPGPTVKELTIDPDGVVTASP